MTKTTKSLKKRFEELDEKNDEMLDELLEKVSRNWDANDEDKFAEFDTRTYVHLMSEVLEAAAEVLKGINLDDVYDVLEHMKDTDVYNLYNTMRSMGMALSIKYTYKGFLGAVENRTLEESDLISIQSYMIRHSGSWVG